MGRGVDGCGDGRRRRTACFIAGESPFGQFLIRARSPLQSSDATIALFICKRLLYALSRANARRHGAALAGFVFLGVLCFY